MVQALLMGFEVVAGKDVAAGDFPGTNSSSVGAV